MRETRPDHPCFRPPRIFSRDDCVATLSFRRQNFGNLLPSQPSLVEYFQIPYMCIGAPRNFVALGQGYARLAS